MNKLLIQPGLHKGTLEITDVPLLMDADSSAIIYKQLVMKRPRSQITNGKILSFVAKETFTSKSFMSSLFDLVLMDWLAQGFFQLLSSVSFYLAPLALQRILQHVSTHLPNFHGNTSVLPISPTVALMMLFLGPALTGFGEGQNYGNLNVLYIK